ncbi:alpha amylase catalytic region [Candidatus Vecturithrix granuli]|uniref:Alpha amylase catalytic region n=1 Tax=Vecturithrix granuli TaxID=1499967 RepID=A0A0S6W926_VECG1|nr:alpha amylase catalytic region [Candidatus Vecturithrix granuli]
MDALQQTLSFLWHDLYGRQADETLTAFLTELTSIKQQHFAIPRAVDTTWYKDAIVYSTYADFFARDFKGLQAKLPYLQELGVTCLWLLPILQSPMKDAGFDISDFEEIRAEVLGLPPEASKAEKDRAFAEFLEDAHTRGIRLIFDIAINHTSNEHPWFLEARQSKDSPKRDYYIWSDTPEKFPKARLLMKDFHNSNWAWDETAGQYYLHRFFEIQPDLNYHNPNVLVDMTTMLIRWKIKGIDGIRADAVPFLWKEEGTTCESLPETHTIVKFFRTALDYLEPGTLLLAEACQPPKDVVAYFGEGDECQGAYHFPVMPRIYRALAEEKGQAIEMVMHPDFTPAIPESAQWFMFLRCHDELSLEMVTPEERTFIFEYYTKDPRWNYRQGEGIAARLANIFEQDQRKITLAYSIMFTLPGTPIIYYGDEFATLNNERYYQEALQRTGYADSRNFVRGPIDWSRVEQELQNPDSLAYQVYQALQQMIRVRKDHPAFSRGALEFAHLHDAEGGVNPHILAYRRSVPSETLVVVQNLSSREQRGKLLIEVKKSKDLLDHELHWHDEYIVLPPYSFYWL